jgi:hypothetical protein
LAADCLRFESRGKPVVGFAVDSLSRTVGRALLRAHGFPNYPLIEIPAPFFESIAPTDEDFEVKIQAAVEAGLRLLFTGSPHEPERAR